MFVFLRIYNMNSNFQVYARKNWEKCLILLICVHQLISLFWKKNVIITVNSKIWRENRENKVLNEMIGVVVGTLFLYQYEKDFKINQIMCS